MKILACGLILLMLPSSKAAEELEVTYEVFSLPMNVAAKLRRAELGGEKAYARLIDGLERNNVRQEQFTVLKLRREVPSTVEEIQEFIFPTEYEGSLSYCVGSQVGLSGLPAPFPTRPDVTAYDTKNLGQTLELMVSRVGTSYRIKICATKVGLISFDAFGWGMAQIEMPRFTIQSLRSEFGVTLEKPALVGTVSPPKPMQTTGAKRVWLAFVTLVRQEKE